MASELSIGGRREQSCYEDSYYGDMKHCQHRLKGHFLSARRTNYYSLLDLEYLWVDRQETLKN